MRGRANILAVALLSFVFFSTLYSWKILILELSYHKYFLTNSYSSCHWIFHKLGLNAIFGTCTVSGSFTATLTWYQTCASSTCSRILHNWWTSISYFFYLGPLIFQGKQRRFGLLLKILLERSKLFSIRGQICRMGGGLRNRIFLLVGKFEEFLA